ncbi:hypothetical protein BH18ACT5_BH18ACT5_04580 [soil metagenome]
MLPEKIPCTDCDGTLHLLTTIDNEVPLLPGETLVYRCDSCMERFDIVWEGED